MEAHGMLVALLRPKLRFVDVRELGGFDERARRLMPKLQTPESPTGEHAEHAIGYRHMVSSLTLARPPVVVRALHKLRAQLAQRHAALSHAQTRVPFCPVRTVPLHVDAVVPRPARV
eukprot:1690449-Prymnesium_polylepis.1